LSLLPFPLNIIEVYVYSKQTKHRYNITTEVILIFLKV